jgi:UDP-N-acetylmuramate--alanine ligase
VTVIDDFAHNPDKITATLSAIHETPGRVIAIYQPHGYGPTRQLRAALVDVFTRHLAPEDHIIMPEIYYAGGTAEKSISAADLIHDIAAQHKNAKFFGRRADIIPYAASLTRPGDRILIMGARDDTLPEFADCFLRALA